MYTPCTIKKMTFEVKTQNVSILVWSTETPRKNSSEASWGFMYPSLRNTNVTLSECDGLGEKRKIEVELFANLSVGKMINWQFPPSLV